MKRKPSSGGYRVAASQAIVRTYLEHVRAEIEHWRSVKLSDKQHASKLAYLVKVTDRALCAMEKGSRDELFNAAFSAGYALCHFEQWECHQRGYKSLVGHLDRRQKQRDQVDDKRGDYCKRVVEILNADDCPLWGGKPNMSAIFERVADEIRAEGRRRPDASAIRKAWNKSLG